MNILEEIVAGKQKEVEILRENTSFSDLQKSLFFRIPTLSLVKYIRDPGRSGIIAEFKRRSPSGGILNPNADVKEVTTGYSSSGASGLSILTDRYFFGGECRDLTITRLNNNIPILRKEFIIDEIQVIESKAAGSDAILLIAAILEKDQIRKLSSLAHSLKMEVILEVHSLYDLEKADKYVNIIGVNNRNLTTMKTDTNISVKLAKDLPSDFLKISESGISSAETVKELRDHGYEGFLVGEAFMKTPDPVVAFANFVKSCKS
jgi:indole-3-glycerol phosphate synthase